MSQPQGKLSRRTLFAGAGTVGAIATVASLAPAVKPVAELNPLPKEAPVKGGGYQLSEHVKRYYQTTKI